MNITSKNAVLGVAYFLLATLLTGIFLANKFWLYSSVGAMIASGSIAAAKWLIQIGAAFILLTGNRKWEFIKRIGWVCLVGSSILFTYNLMGGWPLPLNGFSQFVLAIALAVAVMILLYYKAVQKAGLPVTWFWGWIVCLAIAIALQLTVIF